MKKTILLLFIAIAALGCKKGGLSPGSESLISSENITDYYANDSTLSYHVNMQYDDHNRLVTVNYQYDSFQYVPLQYDYFYDANSNIVKVSTIEGSDTTGSIINTYSNGIPVSTSYLPEGSTNAVPEAIYTVAGDRISKSAFQNLGYPETESFSYNGNNYHVLSYSDGASYTFTYGTHKSPFLYTGFKYCLFGLNYIVNDNEILENREVASNGAVNDYKFVYTYNSDGYPVKEEDSDNGTLIETVVFSYVSKQ